LIRSGFRVMADQLLMGTLEGWDVAVAYALTADTVNAALMRGTTATPRAGMSSGARWRAT
jgi:hypothetical protein